MPKISAKVIDFLQEYEDDRETVKDAVRNLAAEQMAEMVFKLSDAIIDVTHAEVERISKADDLHSEALGYIIGGLAAAKAAGDFFSKNPMAACAGLYTAKRILTDAVDKLEASEKLMLELVNGTVKSKMRESQDGN